MAEFFGYEIKKKEATKGQSFVAPSDEEGTLDVAGGAGFFSQYLPSYDRTAKNDWDLIRKYRQTAEHPETDQAIEDIINEAITADEDDTSVRVNLDMTHLSSPIKKKVDEEFREILRLLNWKHKGADVFRRWYIDSKLFYHKMIDENSPRKGITELRYIEVTKDQYEKFKNKDESVAWQYYTAFTLPWDITGNKEEVYKVNRNIVLITEQNIKRRGL